MKKTNEARGITLIALVITIIVLLILAGISIMMLTGENSILNRSTQAKEDTIIGQEKEAITIAYSGALTDEKGGEVSDTKFTSELVKNGNDAKAKKNANGYKVTFNDTKHVYQYYLNQNKIERLADATDSDVPTLLDMVTAGKACENPASCTEETHVHIGEYIAYTPSDESASVTVKEADTGYNAEQTFTVDTKAQWRVLGISADGEHVLLTTESPIRKAKNKDSEGTETTNDPYLVLQGARGYASCIATLNTICGIYANSSLGTARSITMEDIDAALGVVVEKDANGVPTKVYESAEEVAEGEEHTNKDFFKLQGATDYYEYQSTNEYAPENYLGTGSKKVGDKVYRSAYGYLANNIFGDSAYDKYALQYANATAKDIIFKGTDSGDMAKAYWLASSGAYAGSSCAYFGPGVVLVGYASSVGSNLFSSNGHWGAVGLAVRPVVSLDSEVTLEDVGGKTTGSETPWTVPDGVKGPSDSRASGRLSGDTGKVLANE